MPASNNGENNGKQNIVRCKDELLTARVLFESDM